MMCPFCRETEVGHKTGSNTCPACKAGFEIDDRGECIFVDTDNPRIPVDGLVQEGKWGSCERVGKMIRRLILPNLTVAILLFFAFFIKSVNANYSENRKNKLNRILKNHEIQN